MVSIPSRVVVDGNGHSNDLFL